MQLQAPRRTHLTTTPLSLQCGKRQRAYQQTYQNVEKCAHTAYTVRATPS